MRSYAGISSRVFDIHVGPQSRKPAIEVVLVLRDDQFTTASDGSLVPDPLTPLMTQAFVIDPGDLRELVAELTKLADQAEGGHQ